MAQLAEKNASEKTIMVETSNTKSNESSASNAYRDFTLALNSPQSRRKYVGRLKIFFDFISIPQLSIEERCQIFISQAQNNETWASDKIIQFLVYQGRKEGNCGFYDSEL